MNCTGFDGSHAEAGADMTARAHTDMATPSTPRRRNGIMDFLQK
jgi:hypothetical protein